MKNTIDHYKKQIRAAIEANGEYSHNICSIILRQVAEEFDTTTANSLVDHFNLEDIYGISKVE